MRRALLLLAALAPAIASCEQGKRPVIQAQFCLTPEHGPSELIDTFKIIARDEGMDYFQRGDGSEELGRPLEATENGSRQLLPHGFEVTVDSTDDRDGFSAAVSGIPSNQVMMGFSEGHDRRLSVAFARRVIARLRDKWDVHLVSGEVGMFPLKGC